MFIRFQIKENINTLNQRITVVTYYCKICENIRNFKYSILKATNLNII